MLCTFVYLYDRSVSFLPVTVTILAQTQELNPQEVRSRAPEISALSDGQGEHAEFGHRLHQRGCHDRASVSRACSRACSRAPPWSGWRTRLGSPSYRSRCECNPWPRSLKCGEVAKTELCRGGVESQVAGGAGKEACRARCCPGGCNQESRRLCINRVHTGQQ